MSRSPRRQTAASDDPKLSPAASVSLDRGELEQTLGFVLRRTWVHMEQVYNKVMADTGITPQLFAMLIVIERNPGCRISDVSRSIGVSPNNIVPAMDVLLDRGLVSWDFSSHDRRAKRLRLTETGVTYLAELRKQHQPVTALFMDRLGSEGMQTLIALLKVASGDDRD